MDLDVSSESRAALAAQGWTKDRSVDVSALIGRLEAVGFRVDDWMRGVLGSLVGIRVSPVNEDGVNFQNGDPFVVDPLAIGVRHFSEARELQDRFKVTFCPLGWWLCRSHVYFSTEGPVVASLPGVIWHVGSTLSEAIDMMLLGNRPLVRLLSEDGMESRDF
ncbi:hypothetical protein Acsp04_18710 [Actinomadura sp. NBRC 104425]|uniref:SUKH-3 domain-containing protein n=1 Tax=Actinomadura sp. NBRC 104425 TaxID=3032204 RepID=UPI0024A49A45|nr:SUKH-3 domain-containing protein [Actinomadura sp. NBRC 104425]GLZ11636.1 hypothetical protein Acsp04_18710 [Actinomadura sp. NBRC 104425]